MKRLLYLFTFLCFTSAMLAQLPTGGPDAFGYTWKTSTASGGPTYNWIDITTIGTAVSGLSDDNVIGPLPMGINFHYYWSSYNQIYIGSNGYVGFQPLNISSTTIGFPNLPTTADGNDNFVAPLMCDLTFASAGNPGQCYTWTNNIDTCIVSYHNVPFWINNATQYGGSNTFQVIFSAVDSSITYQYQSQTGTYDAAYATATNPVVIGIENVTGAIGLMTSNNVLPTPPFAIKYDYPGTITLNVPDVTPEWVYNTDNGGFFVSQNGAPVFGDAYIQNVGNVNITTPTGVQLNIREAASSTLVHTDANTVTALNVGAGSQVSFNMGYAPTTVGSYVYRVFTSNSADINLSNDFRDIEMVVLNTSPSTYDLHYWSGVPASTANSINWSGGGNDEGLAMYIEPPTYPVEIENVNAYVFVTGTGIVGPTAFEVKIFDDNASPGLGTVLATASVPAASVVTDAWNLVTLPSPVLINSGGFYVAWYMNGENIALATDIQIPFSLRNYEILANTWAPFRNSTTQDLMLQVGMKKSCAAAQQVSLGPNLDLCQGQSLTLDAGSGFTAYNWSTGATTQTTTVTNGGVYVVQVSDNGCPSTDTIVVSLLPAPSVNIGPDQVVCADNPVVLDAGTGFNGYSWSTGASTQSITVNTSGNYTVTVTGSNGCTGTDNALITVNPLPTINLGPDQTICAGDMVTLSAGSGFFSYAWSTGSADPSIMVSDPGLYSVTVYDFNGCGNSDTVEVIVSSPQIDLGAPVSFCEGSSTTISGPPGFAAYVWNTGSSSPNITVSTGGIYTLTVSDNMGCLGSDSIEVIEEPMPVAGFMVASMSGLTVNFMSTSSDANGWLWNFGDGGTSMLENPSHTYSVAGTYTVTLTASNMCGSTNHFEAVMVSGTAVDPDLFKEELSIFPVPALESLWLQIEGLQLHNLTLSVNDLQGKTIRRMAIGNINGDQEINIPLDGIAAGIYLLGVQSEEVTVNRKFVIGR